MRALRACLVVCYQLCELFDAYARSNSTNLYQLSHECSSLCYRCSAVLFACAQQTTLNSTKVLDFYRTITDVSTAAASAAAAVEAIDTAVVEGSSSACAALLVWVKAVAKSAEVAATKRADDEVIY
jgi:hypothetical protein